MEKLKEFQVKSVKNNNNFKSTKITKSSDAYGVIKQFYFGDIDIFESFFILLMNRSNQTVGYAKISQGGIAGTVVDVKIIAKYCIDTLCSGVILAHNHPSGSLVPSEADKKITKKIKDGLNLIDVQVLDHIILTENNYYSFGDNGLI